MSEISGGSSSCETLATRSSRALRACSSTVTTREPASPPPSYDGFATGFHVFGQEPHGEWFHHLSASTEPEAEDEASALLRDGCKVQIVPGPVNLHVILDRLNQTQPEG